MTHHTQTRIAHSSAYTQAELSALRLFAPKILLSASEVSRSLWGKTIPAPAGAILRRLERLGAVEYVEPRLWRITPLGQTIQTTL